MNNQNNKILTMLVSLSAVVAIAIIFIVVNQANSSDDAITKATQTTYLSTTASPTITSSSTPSNTKSDSTSIQTADSGETDATLSIVTNRCTGCGKCAQIDPEHFNVSGRTASVISQNNLSSASLEQAINTCHNNAISLG